jgi:hypothetical protein
MRRLRTEPHPAAIIKIVVQIFGLLDEAALYFNEDTYYVLVYSEMVSIK